MLKGCFKGKKNRYFFIKNVLALSVILLFLSFPMSSLGLSKTLIEIEPSPISVEQNDIFTVNIFVTPDTPISGVQCDVIFDPSLLYAMDATIGSLFEGYNAVNSDCKINNTGGKIERIFSVVLSPYFDTLVDPDVFAEITFFVNETSGSGTYIDLINVIIADGNAIPVPIDISNGSLLFSGQSYFPWDINMDGTIGLGDFDLLAGNWLSTGDPGWIRADINQNGIVGIGDFDLLASHWGE